jgi:hypothetical protein
MTFGDAMRLVCEGHKVRRPHWAFHEAYEEYVYSVAGMVSRHVVADWKPTDHSDYRFSCEDAIADDWVVVEESAP